VTVSKLKQTLRAHKDPKKAKVLQGFFKTGPGEYGEGDKFLGIKVPILRSIAQQFLALKLEQLSDLIDASFHEERLVTLLILVERYKKYDDEALREEIYEFYCRHMDSINNWDLVDLSAQYIVGHYLFARKKTILKEWAKDPNLWVRRIAIVSTHYFIRQNQFSETLKIAKLLLNDQEDLIHKAVGWMLREVGKRNLGEEEKFLKQHYQKMPRTMLRYAIERFPEKKRQAYLKGTI